MSQIFDALQQSEGQDARKDSSTALEATELLRRAERRMAEKWETGALPEKSDAGGLAIAPGTEKPTAVEESDPFSKVRSLKVSRGQRRENCHATRSTGCHEGEPGAAVRAALPDSADP